VALHVAPEAHWALIQNRAVGPALLLYERLEGPLVTPHPSYAVTRVLLLASQSRSWVF
jgi:hypothetical protein